MSLADPDAPPDDRPPADAALRALVLRAQQGDRAAFSALVEGQYSFIFSVAFKWCGQREEAEDVAQEVCIKLARAITGFEGRSAVRTWLYRVTLNAVRDAQRARGRREKPLEPLGEAALDVPAEAGAEDDEALWAAVRSLPPRQRDSVLLVYAEAKSHAEAGAILGCSESTVSWHIHEAKRALKQFFDGERHG